ncbi:hypothetical protein [Agrococcus jejuensis]|uniref:Uncharacterized protein n=1 Tax=Agrococcus jejuensis TaxID=399736 RepID=A0A1G8AMJ6_9MICO|nr:hypothetical protein [Agrococcus jejuensis]SDH22191.1 hypothetical protein SAMN04489720_0454 [Agrococcus jejuensis]
MKTSRLLALPAIAAAAVLTMTGCFQLPGAPTSPGTTTPADGGSGDGASTELAGTSWSGGDGGNTMSFTLNADGSIDFSEWNDQGGFDVPEDTWVVSGSDVTLTITTNEGNLVYTGPAATGSMSLTGSGTAAGQTLSITQG